MKVLIVDDNVAIREIIAEILTVDGYIIRHASNVEEAYKEISEFEPDITLLDTVVNGKSMMGFVDSLKEISQTKLILLTSGNELIPKDTSMIVGVIRKPFKSTEILDEVRKQSRIQEPQKVAKKDKKFRFFLFGKDSATEGVEDSDEYYIRFGKSYVVFEDLPTDIYYVAQQFVPQGCDLIIVTSDRIKNVADRVKDDHAKIVGLTQRPKVGYIDYSLLGTIMTEIMTHVDSSVRPVVVIDDLSRIIEINGLNRTLTMVYQILTGASRKISMAISVKESLLTDKDRNLLLHYMEQYKYNEDAMKEE